VATEAQLLPDKMPLVVLGKPPQEFILDKTVKTKVATVAVAEQAVAGMQADRAVAHVMVTKVVSLVIMDQIWEMLLPILAGARPAELANHTILDQWDMVGLPDRMVPADMWFLT
jgi:hypothetical protein